MVSVGLFGGVASAFLKRLQKDVQADVTRFLMVVATSLMVCGVAFAILRNVLPSANKPVNCLYVLLAKVLIASALGSLL